MQQPPIHTIKPTIIQLPQPIRLDNGTEVKLIPLQATDLVSMSFVFNGGTWGQDKLLQSYTTICQLRSGAGEYSADTIDELLDNYGATMGGTTCSINFSLLRMTSLKRKLADVLPLLRAIITNPSFEQHKLDNFVEGGIMMLNISKQRVRNVCRRLFSEQVYGKQHPVAHFGDPEDFMNIKRDDLIDHHRKFINMSNATIYLAGKIDDYVIDTLNQHIGTIEASHQAPIVIADKAIQPAASKFYETEIEVESVQSAIYMGKTVPGPANPDFPAIRLFSIILGGYFGSRLTKNIREQRGLTYDIGCGIQIFPYSAIFTIDTETTRENVPLCIEEIKKEIIDLQTNLVPDDEMMQAKRFSLGRFCRLSEASLSLSNFMITKEYAGQSLTDWSIEQTRIQEVTAEEVRAVARKYFSTDEMFVTAVHGKSVK